MKILLEFPYSFCIIMNGEFIKSWHENDLTLKHYLYAHDLPLCGSHIVYWKDLVDAPSELYEEFDRNDDSQMYEKYFKSVLIRNLGYDNVC